ncbi:hypothetical protein ACH3WN_32660 [Streptomyces albogriseolus]|uniref:hypothetical protein n=1 Tax=Streptomyces albogriseolus TaxID=1887 RepID=UPI0037B5A15E
MPVIDGALSIDDLDAQVRAKLRTALPDGHGDSFMRQLWAWWYEQTVEMLQKRHTRDDYTSDRLPTLVERDDFPAEGEAGLSDAPFVPQLRWIGAHRQLNKAMVDYYRSLHPDSGLTRRRPGCPR